MYLRRYQASDCQDVERLWKGYYSDEFSLPELFPRIIEAIVEDSTGQVVGFGVVKVFAEAVMVLDKAKSTRDRAEIMNLLMDAAVDGTSRAEIKQLHVFVADESFGELLRKHYEFKEPKLKALVKEID